jgi:hypothetical protein
LTEGQRTEYTRSDVVLKTIWYRVIHREKWLSTGFSTGEKKHRKAQMHKNAQSGPDPKIDFSSIL